VLRRFAISFVLIALGIACHARTRPHYGGTLRVEIEGDPWQRPDGMARRLVFDGLTRVNRDGTVSPALAVRWSSEADNHRWQFWLRTGIHFSDGTGITSADVVTSLNASCPSDCPWTAVRAAGSSVIFTGDMPMPVLPSLLASDAYLISKSGASSEFATGGLVGTGAFQPAGFANGTLTLAANENGWQGRPFVDAIQLRVHRSIHDQWLDLGLGRADVVEVPAEQMRAAQQQHFAVISAPLVTLLAIEISDNGALSNPLLRASIAASIDRSVLSNVIFQKQAEVTASVLPARISGYSFLFPPDRDLNRAHDLRGGLTPRQLNLAYQGGPTMQLTAQRIALNLREAGFNVQPTNAFPRGDLTLRTINLEDGNPRSALESILRDTDAPAAIPDSSPSALYKVEHEFLEHHTLVPLLYLPRMFAISGRLHDMTLDAAGFPDLANVSLGDTP
jgi:MarR-like DNA-binding transcriptional regulator SgrR of sgrS sRNA